MKTNSRPDFRTLFAGQAALPDSEVDLPRAALYIAGEEYPNLDVDHYLDRLNEMAAGARSLTANNASGETLARTLNRYLFDQEGFSGNAGDYYNPQNSFLNRVMETGIGIPITLSVLYLGLARRLGLACHGVGMPGHFLVKIQELDLYMDPFHGGQLLSAADCRRLAGNLFGPSLEWDERLLSPTPGKTILVRMLNNLRLIYSHHRDWSRLVGVLERMLLFDQANLSLHRDLALCHVTQGDVDAAVRSLEGLISASTSEGDVATARNLIESILRKG